MCVNLTCVSLSRLWCDSFSSSVFCLKLDVSKNLKMNKLVVVVALWRTVTGLFVLCLCVLRTAHAHERHTETPGTSYRGRKEKSSLLQKSEEKSLAFLCKYTLGLFDLLSICRSFGNETENIPTPNFPCF